MKNREDFEIEDGLENGEEKESWLKRNYISIFLIFFAFLLGLLIMGWQYRKVANESLITKNEIIETKKSLQKEKIKTLIMSSVIESQRGEYDLALVDTNRFFNSLRSEIDKKDDSAYLVEEKIRLKRTFEYRDLTIASLARREESAVDKLMEIYLFYLRAIGESRKGSQRKDPKIDENNNINTNINNSANANI